MQTYNVGDTALYGDLTPLEEVKILAIPGNDIYDIEFKSDGQIFQNVVGQIYLKEKE